MEFLRELSGWKVMMWGACLVWLSGCDDTRLIGRVIQVDTFTQKGQLVEDDFTQDGKSQADTFVQNGYHQTDFYTQNVPGQIDILWVVDNSPSMIEEQASLAANFGSFIRYIDQSQIDYHIGVISTDMDKPRNPTHSGQLLGDPKIIVRNPEAAKQFANNVKVGTTGGGFEEGLLAAYTALSPELLGGPNTGFVRSDAALAVIFVSDEDDNSYGDVAAYSRFFSLYKGVGNERNVISAAIVGPIPDGCKTAGAGERYHKLVEKVGGSTESICNSNFATALEQLGLTVAGLGRKFNLSRVPDPTTIKITVNGKEVKKDDTNGWRYDPNQKAIFFNGSSIPPPSSTVQIDYDNLAREFKLSGRGDITTFKVTVDADGVGPGLPKEIPNDAATGWEYDAKSNAVVFKGSYVPPLDSKIIITYSDLRREFPLSQEVKNPFTLKVELDRDGSGFREVIQDSVRGWVYYPNTNSILFQGNLVPNLGGKIRVTYANLQCQFQLTKDPDPLTLNVEIDADGSAGANPPRSVPEYRESPLRQGWWYKGGGILSFEKTTCPNTDSVIIVSYEPATTTTS